MATVIQQLGGRIPEERLPDLESRESSVDNNKKEAEQLIDKGKSAAAK
jgi:hypothetical protein